MVHTQAVDEEDMLPMKQQQHAVNHVEHQPDPGIDSDDDDGLSDSHGGHTLSEKRRAQNALMRAFADNIDLHLSQMEIEKATSKSSKEEQLSIRDILAKQETSVRIQNPRDYQIELFQRATTENIIAVLDTGSGKTHIATLLLRHILEEELDNRAKGQPHKIALFLVDSVNLVFQQANVLQCGLDQAVEGICGASGASLWSKATWLQHFHKHMVIVCTAEVFVQCLMHSFIKISQVNLLIFDEAHHAKNNHPYARLMNDYFIREADQSKRPRIFGMTASPVDVKGLSAEHITNAATDLERLLHAKIATVADNTLISNNISRPEEEVAIYKQLPEEYETCFYEQLRSRYGHILAFKKFFSASKKYSSELGRWAADMYWSFALTEEQSARLQNNEQFKHNQSMEHKAQTWDHLVKQVQDAVNFISQHNFGTPTLSSQDVSSKVQTLHSWLSLYYERTDQARCIVFVEKRQTARLLHLIFKELGGPNLRCDTLVGINNRIGEQTVSLRNQILTLAKFRRGELNCLFSTSVAEEGLDIPQCNLVVRFDLYRTMIAYVQSRGRARHQNSRYLHMLEDGNDNHRGRLVEVRSDEREMRRFCDGISRSEDPFGLDEELPALEDKLFPRHVEPSTGATLTYRSSLSVLHHFVATWPYPNHATMVQPSFVISSASSQHFCQNQQRGFICEIILPEGSPISSLVGDTQSRKIIARCNTAFKLCVLLREKGLLDEHLLPTVARKLPALANAMLAVNEKKKGRYPMLIKPQFWKQGRGTVPAWIYLTIIDAETGLERPHQPLGILTRSPLPQLPEFPIYLDTGRPTNIVSRPFTAPISISVEILEKVTTFTLKIFEHVYNKIYDHDVHKISYWVVPISSSMLPATNPSTNIEQVLDMAQIDTICLEPHWRWKSKKDNENLANKYFMDPFHGGRRYFSDKIAAQLKPFDPIPADCSVSGHRFKESILDYTDSKWTRTRDLSAWDSSQPVLEVQKIPFRRNLLAFAEDKERSELRSLKAYVCPQLLLISNFSAGFVVMCYVLPAIIHRFEDYLIALEACDMLGFHVSPALALEALTKDSENTGEHDEEQINFKSGMGPNYERLEFLGDCFLKMATSISVFVQQPDENEFEFHVRRMQMLCNKNLMETAVGEKIDESADDSSRNLQLYKYIRTEAFSRRLWYPEGLKLIRGKGKDKRGEDWLSQTHNLGDKSIADVCEAFIGAAFMEHHQIGDWAPSNWDKAVKAVKLFANSKDHLMSKWSDYYAAYEKPKYQTAESTESMKNMAEQIETQHSHRFKYPRLVRSAFTHPSFPFHYENIPNYQRLEFLGDSLLDMAFIMHLFYKYHDKDPHWLTEHKTPMVSNKFLGAVCVKLGWYTHIKHTGAFLASQIRDYVVEVQEAEREANGAMEYWTTVSEPPKCLADVIEAYVAAMFVDSEFDFTVVQTFFDTHLKPFFLDMTLEAYETFSNKHPTTRLANMLSMSFGCSDWRMGALETKTILPGHSKSVAAMVVIHNEVRFHSLGQSGRYARIRASQAALEKLDGLAPKEFREMYGCDCVEREEMGKKELAEAMREQMGLNV